MANSEYYLSNEFKSTSEYKEFKAEIYIKPDEFKRTTPEIKDTGPESVFMEPPKEVQEEKKKNKKESGESKRKRIKSFFDKIHSSTSSLIGTVTAAAAVAVSAVVVCTNLFVPVSDIEEPERPPIVEDEPVISPAPAITENKLSAGANYALFDVEVEGMTESVNYSIKLLQNGSVIYEAVVREGSNSATIEELSPETEYILQVDGTEESGTHIYYEKAITTEGEDGSFIYKEYGASLGTIFSENILVEWGENENLITIYTDFTSEKEGVFGYVLTLFDENDNAVATYEGTDSTASLNVPKGVSKVSCVYEKIGYTKDFKYSFGKEKAEESIILSAPVISFEGIKLENIGVHALMVKINSEIPELESYIDLSVYVDGQDGVSYPVYELLKPNRLHKAFLETEPGVERITFYAVLTLNRAYGGAEQTITTDKFTYDVGIDYSSDIRYSYSNGQILMDFLYNAPEGTYVSLVNTITGEETKIEDSYYYFTPTEDIVEYTHTLMSPEGVALTESEAVRFDLTQEKPEASIAGRNPGDVLLTYNDNETMNMYINLDFQSEDPDVYYEVIYGDYVFTSRDRVAKIENIPIDDYPLIYNVICEKDGARYLIQTIHPSGTTDSKSLYGVFVEYNETSIDISMYDNISVIGDVSVIVNGTEYTIPSESFIHSAELGKRNYILEIGEMPMYVKITLYASTAENDYQLIAEIIGAENIKGTIYNEYIIESENYNYEG